MPEPVAISLCNVSKTYRLYESLTDQALDVLGLSVLRFWSPPRYREHPALTNVSLQIQRGERVGILGRNGAGKTTLLKLITGNFASTSGSISVNGKVQALMHVGLGFHPEFTGYENILASLAYNGLDQKELASVAKEIIDFVELGDFLHQPMKTYSLGMQARVMFASATAIKPDILIVDEVLGAGDAYFAAKSADRMRRLAFSGCTLLLVSHTMQQIIQFCDSAIWLDAGRVAMHGPAREVVGAYEVDSERRVQVTVPRAGTSQSTEMQQAEQFANRPWLASRIEERERTLAQLEVTAFETVLRDGRRVMRWPSARGVKIESLRLVQNNVVTSTFESGKSLEIEMEIRAEISGEVTCRYYFSVFGVDGRRAAWVTSLEDTFPGLEGQIRRVRVRLEPLLLGRGNYVLSTSIFDGTDPSEISSATRYDLLARCIEFKVFDRDARDPPIFHHPAEWQFTALAEPSQDPHQSTA